MLPFLFILPAFCLTVAAPDNPFTPARKPHATVTITLTPDPPDPKLLAQPPAAQRTAGLLAQLQGQQLTDLYNTVDLKAPPPAPEGSKPTRIVYLHITPPPNSKEPGRVIAIDQLDTGPLTATIINPPIGAKSVPLKRPALDALFYPLGYTGSLNDDDIKETRAQVFEVPKPYQHGPFTLDQHTNQDRFGSTGSIRYDPAKRNLDTESFFARLPKNYDPSKPSALLVWLDPTPAGKPWPNAFKAADELNCLIIGAANAGNDRLVTDRLQLALDAVATARRRWRIDDRRIYAFGVSGGGKMSSILLPCFPDIFTGAVPIVGLSTYLPVPTGEGKKIWRPDYTKPPVPRWDLFLSHRMAPITGDKDFNHAPVTAMTAALLADMAQKTPTVRLCDLPGLAHEFPPADDFLAQLQWVDEPNHPDEPRTK